MMNEDLRELLLSTTVSVNDTEVTISCYNLDVKDLILDFLLGASDAGFDATSNADNS